MVNAGTNIDLNTETLYEETFAGQNGKGAIGNSICNWTIDVSSANLSNTYDYLKLIMKIEARDVDGICYWYSPVINIQNYLKPFSSQVKFLVQIDMRWMIFLLT